jgi:4'-phosphopantetheinyl transferase EntD
MDGFNLMPGVPGMKECPQWPVTVAGSPERSV